MSKQLNTLTVTETPCRVQWGRVDRFQSALGLLGSFPIQVCKNLNNIRFRPEAAKNKNLFEVLLMFVGPFGPAVSLNQRFVRDRCVAEKNLLLKVCVFNISTFEHAVHTLAAEVGKVLSRCRGSQGQKCKKDKCFHHGTHENWNAGTQHIRKLRVSYGVLMNSVFLRDGCRFWSMEVAA